MEREPFLGSQTRPQRQLEAILEEERDHDSLLAVPQSLSSPHIFNEIENSDQPQSQAPPKSSTTWKPGSLHRSKTAPALIVLHDVNKQASQVPKPNSESSSIIRQAFVLLSIYLCVGVVIYSFNREHFSGIETHPVVDALYFCIVTMCTIGYGDIAPLTPATKGFACVFVLVGFGFIDILLSGVVNYVLDLQENMILTGIEMDKVKEGFSASNYIVDVAKGRMRIRLKVGLALGVVVLSIGIGAMILFFLEGLGWLDAFYLSVMSVTTVGYGDKAFKTLPGRFFAAIWLLFSTLMVARAFLYLVEARIDKRHRRIAKWMLQREITIEDLLAADTNHNGFIRSAF